MMKNFIAEIVVFNCIGRTIFKLISAPGPAFVALVQFPALAQNQFVYKGFAQNNVLSQILSIKAAQQLRIIVKKK